MSKTKLTMVATGIFLLACNAYAQQAGPMGEIQTERIRPVNSAEQYRPSLDLRVGLANPEGDEDSAMNVILGISYQPVIPFSLGVEASFENFEQERWGLLAKSTYNFAGSGILGGSYFGAAAGMAWEDSTAYGALAPLAGFIIPIDYRVGEDQLSVGAEARYMMVSNDRNNAFHFNGGVRYWF